MELAIQIMTRAKILVVDDEPSLREVVGAAMVMNDWEATTACSGEEALEAIKRDRPDLVILDVTMPGESGYQICRRIRERDGQLQRRTPVILLTARDLSDDPEREAMVVSSGLADAMLYKPVAMDVLIGTVRQLLPHDLDRSGGTAVVVDPEAD